MEWIMIRALVTAWALATFGAGVARSQPTHRPQPVAHVDLDRYVGSWYEIAKIPNKFQKQCVGGTTAEYRLREDGRIDVINRCRTANGVVDEARGIARVVDEKSNARLKVSFVRFLGRNWFWGDYWILGLGPDYEYAIVGHPERTYGWILSRTPTLDEATRSSIDAQLRAQGYDLQQFEPTPQDSTSGGE
jgi:apolipoprotein D and lipocalin family protein